MAFARTLSKDLTTSLSKVRDASANGDVIIGMRITNTTVNSIKVSACIKASSVNYYLVGGVAPTTTGADIPPGGSLIIINGDLDKVVLVPGDQIWVISSATSSCDCIISALEN
jgi:hypothetical protein